MSEGSAATSDARLDNETRVGAPSFDTADDDTEAERLFTSAQQAFTNVIAASGGQLSPPVDDIEAHLSSAEKAHVSEPPGPRGD